MKTELADKANSARQQVIEKLILDYKSEIPEAQIPSNEQIKNAGVKLQNKLIDFRISTMP